MDAFLTREERRKIQRLFENWNKHANPEILIPALYGEGIVSERDKQELTTKITSFAKNEYLFDNYLMRSTYDQIQVIKKVLIATGVSAHKVLAEGFPVRTPTVPKEEPMEQEPRMESQSKSTGIGERERAPYQSGPFKGNSKSKGTSDTRQQTFNHSHTSFKQEVPNKATPEPNTQTQNSKTTGTEQQQNSQNTTGSNQQRPDHVPFMAARYDIKTQTYKENLGHVNTKSGDNINPPDNALPIPPTTKIHRPGMPVTPNANILPFYPVKKAGFGKPSAHGRGLCVIFANFINDLDGYKRDIEDITAFFQHKLTYKTMGGFGCHDEKHYRNLTKEEFLVKLREVQDFLNNHDKDIDRLFVFILSHGDQFGIKMRPPDNMDNSVRDRIKSEAITDMFSHNQVPSMKSLPKCFFMQVCRGEEIARAANRPAASGDRTDYENEMDTSDGLLVNELKIHNPKQVAIGADVLVCHAAKEGKYSWVVDRGLDIRGGSWFIQETINVFKEFYLNEHVLDMMTEVNARVSEKVGKTRVRLHGDTRKSDQYAYQLPQIINNLTKKLYL